jgi:hypothetical protein
MALPSDEQAHTRPTATTEAAVGQTGSASSNCLHDTVMMTPRCRNKATTMALERKENSRLRRASFRFRPPWPPASGSRRREGAIHGAKTLAVFRACPM